ncbi:MAG: GNAT family N-acetyltransferase [Acidobacteriota bacterium]
MHPTAEASLTSLPNTEFSAHREEVSVSVLTSEIDFDALREEWDELLSASKQCVYFLRWSWNRLWWQTYAPPHSKLLLITCRDRQHRLVGLAPLYWRQQKTAGIPHIREIYFLGTGTEIKTSEYLDFFARPGYEQAVAQLIATTLTEDHTWDYLYLWGVPTQSTLMPHFHRALGNRAVTEICDHNSYVDTSGDWEMVRQGMGKTLRTNIDRYARRFLKDKEFEFHLATTTSEVEAAMEELIRLHQARWEFKGKPGSFTLPRFEEFLRQIGRIALTENRLRLWTLTVNGQEIAALIAFLDNGIAHYFQGGFDPAFAKDHLGSIMLKFCIEQCIEADNITEFDFMGGGAAYKKHWTGLSRDMLELRLMRNNLHSLPFQTYRWARKRGGQLKRKLRSYWQKQPPA